jgi:hypothetical protein
MLILLGADLMAPSAGAVRHKSATSLYFDFLLLGVMLAAVYVSVVLISLWCRSPEEYRGVPFTRFVPRWLSLLVFGVIGAVGPLSVWLTQLEPNVLLLKHDAWLASALKVCGFSVLSLLTGMCALGAARMQVLRARALPLTAPVPAKLAWMLELDRLDYEAFARARQQ